MGVGHARSSLTEPIPTFKGDPDWRSKCSTKMETCANILKYILQDDLAPPIEFKDGNVIYGLPRQLGPEEKYPQTAKAIIYQEFPSLTPLLKEVSFLFLFLLAVLIRF